MAITFVAETHTTYASRATTTTVTKPTGTVDGDVIIVAVALGNNTPPGAATQPGGWTAFSTSPSTATHGGFAVDITYWWKVASGEGASWNFTHTGTLSTQGIALTYRGVDNTTPVDATPTETVTTSTGATNWTGITTVTDGAMLVAIGQDWADLSNSLAPPAGMTERIDVAASSATVFYAADILEPTAGASGDFTHTNNGVGSSSTGLLLPLRPTVVPPPAGPAYKDAGTPVESTTTGSPGWPTHAIDDVALLLVESAGGEAVTLSNAQGFQAVTNSPSATGALTAGTRISVWWHRATSTSMAAPAIADPGNHFYAVVLTFSGCTTFGNPFNVTAADVKASASTAMSMPAVVTTVENSLIVNIATRDNDSAAAAGSAEANANLTNLAERFDLGTLLGNGGGIMVWTGSLAVPGSSGTTTATVTSSINAYLTIALSPPGRYRLNRYIPNNQADRRAANW